MEGKKMQKMFLIFSAALALALYPILAPALVIETATLVETSAIPEEATSISEVTTPISEVTTPVSEEVASETSSETATEDTEDISDDVVIDPTPSPTPGPAPIPGAEETETENPPAATPLPSALILLGSGLLGLAAYGRRKLR